jgi:hypothetical protein
MADLADYTLVALKEAVCSKIIKRLKQSGVLATSAHSRYSIALDTSPTGKANLDKSYFDPTEGISHHVRSSYNNNSLYTHCLTDLCT